MNHKILMGCIADDFTGASDAASFLVKGGLKAVLYNGIPPIDTHIPDDCNAVVIALKTRTQERASAVHDSLNALRWLKYMGTIQYYIKYCSTFDSTKEGNIGPIADAVMEELQVPYTLLCPALPVNQRIVKNGILYVNNIPLSESHMKYHPLTPMWESSIAKLMEPQSSFPCMVLNYEKLYWKKDILQQEIENFEAANKPFYIIPDYRSEQDAHRIVELFGNLPLLTGGSGILTQLAAHCSIKTPLPLTAEQSGTAGKGIILAGSCSLATLEQIKAFQTANKKTIQIRPLELFHGRQTTESIWNEISHSPENELLIYSSEPPELVKKTQEMGKQQIAALLEKTMSELALLAVKNGFTRIIAAGGETSGAITKMLGFDAYLIGESIAPGVPIMLPLSNSSIRLVLKSGNFGQPDFFLRALRITAKL